MKKFIAHKLINYASKQALKYHQRQKMLLEQEKSTRFIYATGYNIVQRDKWLYRITKIERWIKKY